MVSIRFFMPLMILTVLGGNPTSTLALTKDNKPSEASISSAHTQSQGLFSDILNLLLAAQLAHDRNMPQVALQKYLLASQMSVDPRIAQEATELAIELEAPDVARTTSEIWANGQPNDIRAQMVATTLLISQGVTQAKPYIDRALHAPVPNVDEHFVTIMINLSQTSQHQLSQALNQLAQEHPTHLPTLITAAQLSALVGDVSNTQHWVERILTQQPATTAALELNAKLIRYHTGSDEKALAFLEKSLNTYPDDATLRLFYANALLDHNNTNKALKQFEILSKHDNEYKGDALLFLAQNSVKHNQLERAKTYLNQAATLGPYQAQAYYVLGQLAEKEQKPTDALDWYQKVGEGGEFYLPARIRAGELLSQDKQYDLALALIHDTTPNTLFDVKQLTLAESTILFKTENYSDAMAVLTRALKDIPDDVDLLLARSQIAKALKQYKLVESDLKLILSLDPNNKQAKQELEQLP